MLIRDPGQLFKVMQPFGTFTKDQGIFEAILGAQAILGSLDEDEYELLPAAGNEVKRSPAKKKENVQYPFKKANVAGQPDIYKVITLEGVDDHEYNDRAQGCSLKNLFNGLISGNSMPGVIDAEEEEEE